MSQPTTYVRAFNFQNQQAVTPGDPLRADKVDLEYNLIKTSLDETQANLALIQRDDGAIANASVGYDQLKTEVEIGVNPPSAWVTLHNYVTRDTVTLNAAFYRCLVSHISGVFATDLAAGKWELIADFASAISTTSIAAAIHAAPNKTGLADADEFGGLDSADAYTLRHFTWANVKASMFSAWGALLAAGTAKATPADADVMLLADSAASNATKTFTFANLQEWVRTKLGAMVSANSAKTTPVDADQFLLSDSAASSGPAKLSWLNLVTTVFARFGPAVAAGTSKATPVDADSVLLSDSASSDASKKLTWANIKATLLTYFLGIFPRYDAAQTLNAAQKAQHATNVGMAFSKEYVSANQTITPSTVLTLPHGLTVAPKLIAVDLVCQTAELGYSIGAVISINLGQMSTSIADGYGMSVVKDATNVVLLYGSVTGVFNIIRADTFGAATITAANWRLVVRAWA